MCLGGSCSSFWCQTHWFDQNFLPKLILVRGFRHLCRRKFQELHTAKGITKFTQEEFDTFENYFNEENWFILQTEFEEVVKFEIGAIINQKDEFDWKFGKK